MLLKICPCCKHSLNTRMDRDRGNQIIVYHCENCMYTTFGEAYIESSGSYVGTTGVNNRLCKSESKYVMKKENSKMGSVFTRNDLGRRN